MTDKQNQKLYLLYGTYVLIILIHIIGITCIWVANTIQTNEFPIDYTDCVNIDDEPCKTYMQKYNKNCVCPHSFNLSTNLNGEVILYYELESYNQSNASYIISRDDKQLSGILAEPSEKCEPYRYNEGKPIAPCGAIADTIFNDTFSLIYNDPISKKDDFVPKLYTGLISSDVKSKFRNPPGNLTVAFQNYSKPIHWTLNVYELDKDNPDNNGFQNEKFIAWMQTEWKRKPMWRVVTKDEPFTNGLPAGPYILRVGYNFPPSSYDGIRKVILVSSYECKYCRVWQIVGTLLILCTLTIGIFLLTRFATRNGIILLGGKKPQSDNIRGLMTDRSYPGADGLRAEHQVEY